MKKLLALLTILAGLGFGINAFGNCGSYHGNKEPEEETVTEEIITEDVENVEDVE